MSIAGGYYKAVESARACGCDCVQIFTKNNNQWRAKEITDQDVEQFRLRLRDLNVSHPISHSSYLINLASPDRSLWVRSRDALAVELDRAAQFGIPYVVVHPGAFTTGTERGGIGRIARALDQVHRRRADCRAQVLLETTAGQGSGIGWRFEHLAAILDRVREPDRVGVCFDTCHVFAAGYSLGTPQEYKATMRQFQLTVGLDRIRAFHLNDSKRELGARVDRHEHIGRGKMGIAPFRNLLSDRRFRKIPMYLETSKEMEDGTPMDVINLRRLRRLVRRR